MSNYIRTYTGRSFYPNSPRPGDVSIDDIAQALSNLCRFTGHVSSFYSVAQHSVLVSRMCDPSDALKGLLHDAAEAYVNDLNRPLKYSGLMNEYRDIEDDVSQAIAIAFGLDSLEKPDSVEFADKAIVKREKRDIVARPHFARRLVAFVTGDADFIWPWSPRKAKRQFLKRYKELIRERSAHCAGAHLDLRIAPVEALSSSSI
jgi:uncharacterized protein